jgi:hypothetical protein
MSECLQLSLPWDAEKQQHTAHISTSARIYYPHHPHFGETVQLIRTTSTFGPDQVQVLLPNGNQLVVPLWMLNQERCGSMQIVAQSVIAVDALFALRDLLRSQQRLAEEKLSSSGKCLPGGGSIEAKQTRGTLQEKYSSEVSRDHAPALPRATKSDVSSCDRRKSQDHRRRKK